MWLGETAAQVAVEPKALVFLLLSCMAFNFPFLGRLSMKALSSCMSECGTTLQREGSTGCHLGVVLQQASELTIILLGICLFCHFRHWLRWQV